MIRTGGSIPEERSYGQSLVEVSVMAHDAGPEVSNLLAAIFDHQARERDFYADMRAGIAERKVVQLEEDIAWYKEALAACQRKLAWLSMPMYAEYVELA